MISHARSILTVTAAAAAVILAAAAVAVADPADRDGTGHCRDVTAALPDSGWTVAGTLCSPPAARSVHILLHGYTTNRDYWDFPYHRPAYSYAHAAEAAGFATLRIDLLGSGASDHPVSTALSYDDEAAAVHTVVSALRQGSLGGTGFDTVAIVGHSGGSLVGVLEAARYHDIDALVTTAFTPMFNVDDMATRLLPNVVPAVSDPRFRDSGLDPGYVTTGSGSRAIFYNPADTDAQVIATDETIKDATAMPMLATINPIALSDALHAVDVPVLVVDGADDPFSCGFLASDCSSSAALAAEGRAVYGPHATVEADVVAHGGHNLALEHAAPATTHSTLSFLDRHLGTGRSATTEGGR